jgi:ABC-type glycerol-3-phosphate transport system permease component
MTTPAASSRFVPRRRLSRRVVSAASTALLHVILYGLAFCAVMPFLFMLCACFKTQEDIFRYPLVPWGHLDDLTLANFRALFATKPFARWMVNSIFVTSTYTASVVTLSSLGGFALAKYKFPGKRLLMLVMLLTMLLPVQVLLPASYKLIFRLGWMNSYLAIIVPGAVSVFGMFLFMQAMKAVPDELLQAGRVDGCSELRLWWEVALPIVRPMIGAYTLLSFLSAWNSYLWPNIVLQDESKYTLPIGLAGMVGLPEFESHYGILMAATFLGILPVALLFFLLQKDFISGLATGAVKG